MVGNTTIEVKSTSRQEGLNAPQGSMFTQNVSRQMQQSNVIQVADIMSLDILKQYVLVQSHMSRPILADSPRWFLDNGMRKKAALAPCGNIPEWIAKERMAAWQQAQEQQVAQMQALEAEQPVPQNANQITPPNI